MTQLIRVADDVEGPDLVALNIDVNDQEDLAGLKPQQDARLANWPRTPPSFTW